MRLAPVFLSFLLMGCFTAVTDPNHWEVPFGQMSRWSTDDAVCRDQASYPLQPEMRGELNHETYRTCMENLGWRERS